MSKGHFFKVQYGRSVQIFGFYGFAKLHLNFEFFEGLLICDKRTENNTTSVEITFMQNHTFESLRGKLLP